MDFAIEGIIAMTLMITIVSYKHIFHPFCFKKLLRVNNKFYICAQLFHLDWWCSWGFWEEDENVKMLVVDMYVDEL
jgi:hypothetical protein